jgi:hypothetical protein
LDTAIIVGVVIGSVVAMVLVFSKTVLGVAWTGKSARRIEVSETSNLNSAKQEYFSDIAKRELYSVRTSSDKPINVKKTNVIESLMDKQVLTCDNMTIGKVHAVHNNMMDIEGLSQDKRYEISAYYVRQNLHNSVLMDICASDLEHYRPHVI